MLVQASSPSSAVGSVSALAGVVASPVSDSLCPSARDVDRLSAVVNAVPVEVLSPHQHFDAVPVVATVAAAVRLSFEDLVAALYLWRDGVEYADLRSDAYVRELIVEAVVGRGVAELAEVRQEIGGVDPGTDLWLDVCRARVQDLYGTGTVAGVA